MFFLFIYFEYATINSFEGSKLEANIVGEQINLILYQVLGTDNNTNQ